MVAPPFVSYIKTKWRDYYTFEEARRMMIEHIGDESFLIDPYFRNQVQNFIVENNDSPVENKFSLENWVSFRKAFPRKHIKNETDKEIIYEKTYSYIFFNRAYFLSRLPKKSKQIILQKAEQSFWEPFWTT